MGASPTLELPPCGPCCRDVLLDDGPGINRDAALNPRWLENAGLETEPAPRGCPRSGQTKRSPKLV